MKLDLQKRNLYVPALIFSCITLGACAPIPVHQSYPNQPSYPAPTQPVVVTPVYAPQPVPMPLPAPILRPAAGTQVLQTIGTMAQINVKDRASGQLLPIYLHKGTYYVTGKAGAGYALTLRSNMPNERLLTVLSVDGVNVVTGETAGVGQRGYVLTPRSQHDITGWRKSDSEVVAFNFAAPQASYANQTGRPNNIGVIGMASFRELYVPPPPPAPPISIENRSAQKGDSAARPASKMMPAPAAAPGLGTEHGARETSYASQTTFTRAQATPNEVVQLRYDTTENLVKLGVLEWVDPRTNIPVNTQAFPKQGYVPDPPRRY